MSAVLVLALNPCVDAEWRVDGLRLHEKNLVLVERRWAGGKGVNVARWLQLFGVPMRLLLPLGGETGSEMVRGLRTLGLSARRVHILQSTRVNVVVTAPNGAQLRLNGLGPELSAAEWQRSHQAIRKQLARTSLLVLSGSLPRGAPAGTYAGLIRLAHTFEVRTLLDCDGPALAAGLRARPFLVKPNEYELSQWAGHRLGSEEEIVSAARQMARVTRGWVLVSRAAKGALLVNDAAGVCLRARPPRMRAVNTVGAGDALLAAVAGALLAQHAPEEWLHCGVAAGCAAASRPAGELPSLTAIKRMRQRVNRS